MGYSSCHRRLLLSCSCGLQVPLRWWCESYIATSKARSCYPPRVEKGESNTTAPTSSRITFTVDIGQGLVRYEISEYLSRTYSWSGGEHDGHFPFLTPVHRGVSLSSSTTTFEFHSMDLQRGRFHAWRIVLAFRWAGGAERGGGAEIGKRNVLKIWGVWREIASA
jgi:hypothetical protein